MTKSTDAEISRRVRFVRRMLLRGHTRGDIVRFCSKKWGITSRQIDDYLAYAKEEIEEINKTDMKQNMAMISRNYWEQYRLAHKSKNGFLAVTILEKIAKLKGLSQETLKLVLDDRKDLEALSDEELEIAVSERIQ